MPYKLLALDIDGTLLNSEKRITPRTMSAVRQAMDQGVRVTLCTGRGLLTSASISRRLPMNTPLILNGGALIFDPGRMRALYMRNLTRGMACEAIHRLREIRLHPVVYAPLPASQYFYYDDWDPDNTAFLEYVENNPGRAHRVDDVLQAVWGDPAMVATTGRFERLLPLDGDIAARLPDMTVTFEVSPVDPVFCHVTLTPCGVSKGRGLRELALLLGIDLADTIAVGDNLNDLDMMTTAGLGVAMGNAAEETKRRADYVTVATNDDDGVVEVIVRFIL